MENNQNKAFDKAAGILRTMNIDEICERCKCVRTEDGIEIKYFNEKYEIKLPEVSFNSSHLSQVSQLIILHYLISTGKQKTSGEVVGFRDLPGGMFYYKTYSKQGPERIVKDFGDDLDMIYSVAKSLGGEKASFGDASVRLPALPLIDVLIVLYKADDEFPHEAFVLFKNDIINYLSLKDISMLVGEIATNCKKLKQRIAAEINRTMTDNNFKFEVAARPGAGLFKRCFSCNSCTISCPISDIDENFSPRTFIRQCLLGMKEKLLSSKEIWFCTECNLCYAKCPQNVPFADIMTVFREMAVEEGYAPADMPEKTERIGEISRKLNFELINHAWKCIRKSQDPDFYKNLRMYLEQGIKELE
ncbi:MAG: DUF3786 domain-containing protein [Spirochaetales bacterium]|nr:DUF3786 domain-containing protein [Spirochaetales bacterium]